MSGRITVSIPWRVRSNDVEALACAITNSEGGVPARLSDLGIGSQSDTKVSPIPSSDGFPVDPVILYVEEIKT